MEEKKIKTYEEIFGGLSRLEMFRGCRNRALFDTLVGYTDSYSERKKGYKNKIKLEYRLCSGTIKPRQIPNLFYREWRRETEELDRVCDMLMIWADKSEKEVRREAREYLLKERAEAFPF